MAVTKSSGTDGPSSISRLHTAFRLHAHTAASSFVAKVRLPVCLARPGKLQAQAVLIVAENAATAEVLALAANKLRLIKKEMADARLFLVSTGIELPRDGHVTGCVENDSLVVITLGEPYACARSASKAAGIAPEPTRWLRWEARPEAGSLAVVEWSDARVMNATLGRLSTLLEHPTLCGAETGSIVSHEAQRTLGSSSYLGHNLYASTFLEFERLASAGAGASASAAETGFLALWRECGTPDVVISFVRGERETLRHELCHARFALDTGYRETLHTLWKEAWAPKLHRWMRDLGYHPTRHADEFGAYVLTEPSAFWRGRIGAEDLGLLRERLGRRPGGREGAERHGEHASVPLDVLEVDAAVPKTPIDAWMWSGEGEKEVEDEVEAEVQRLATAEVLEESYVGAVGAAAAAAAEQFVLAGPVVAAGHKEADIM